jgi:CheY-like chemotaxis protein
MLGRAAPLPSLVLLDLQLPKMSGLEVYNGCKQWALKTVIVVIIAGLPLTVKFSEPTFRGEFAVD